MEPKTGSQTPTASFLLPYKFTYGDEAIELYNSTGNTAMEWQASQIRDILSYREDGLYNHTKYGMAVPRRNGKNEVVAIAEMECLKRGERILHTAHRTDTAHMAWERLLDLLTLSEIEVTSSYRAFGKENIRVEGGGVIEFRTRTSKGGLGIGCDFLIIDEAQEYTDDQESALKYVVSSSMNPHTIFCGTPPTPESSGTVFTKFRENTLKGKGVNSGWAEWSVENQVDPHEKEYWYQTNPSLGIRLTERIVEDEISGNDLDFNIQRLGYWVKYSLKSDISEADWKKLKISKVPEFKGKLFVGIKYGSDGANVSMSIAVKTDEGKIFVETVDCRSTRSGNDWILGFLKKASVAKVVIDGASGQKILEEEMIENRIKPSPILPKVSEVIMANSMFTNAIYQEGICHNDQPSLTQVVTNCEKRAIGSSGGFGYRSLKPEADITLLDSVMLAYWQCSVYRERRKQKVRY